MSPALCRSAAAGSLSRNVSARTRRAVSATAERCLSSSSFSTTTTNTTDTNNPDTNSRITKTLYRQLLRWCKTAPHVPLTTLVPPVHLEAPAKVDAFRVEVLSTPPSSTDDDDDAGWDDSVVARVRTILPEQTEVTRKSLTVPVHTVDDIQNVIRAVFRLNQDHPGDVSDPHNTSNEYQKERLTATFTALKSLNELAGGLEKIEKERQKHLNRKHVQFKVGQVVQHQEERWRGVIASWTRPEGSAEPAERTSLTSKDYSGAVQTSVVYDIILDAGDAHSMGSSSGWSQAGQGELNLIEDRALQRIHSNILRDYFINFSATQRRFIPNDLVAYQFPADDVVQTTSLPTADAQRCWEVIRATRDFATRLERCVLDETSCPAARGLTLLHKVLAQLQSVVAGDVFSRQERYQGKDDSPITTASHHLQALLKLNLEIVDINHQRRSCKETEPKIKYNLGDIVRHKLFGFRGVVVTWDPKPVMDVRRWDGVRDIENPMEKPFYHVIPDPNDCIRVFGGERPARYVCEDNLEPCPEAEQNIVVDMEPVWTRTETGYEAPNEIKYRFGEDMEDNGVSERCMTRIQDEFNSLYLLGREANPSDAMASQLSVQKLQGFLQVVDNASDANPVQETIKEMRKAHARRDLRWRLETGVSELLKGQGEDAMEIYKTVLGEDPKYAEAWNKLATCQYMYGRKEESLESTKKALELDPNHLQAIIGLGLIHFENEEYQKAVKQFRQALEIDPWSPIGSKLSMALDLLDRLIIREEILD